MRESESRNGENESLGGEEERKLLVTLDLNLTFMQMSEMTASESDPWAVIGWYSSNRQINVTGSYNWNRLGEVEDISYHSSWGRFPFLFHWRKLLAKYRTINCTCYNNQWYSFPLSRRKIKRKISGTWVLLSDSDNKRGLEKTPHRKCWKFDKICGV